MYICAYIIIKLNSNFMAGYLLLSEVAVNKIFVWKNLLFIRIAQ